MAVTATAARPALADLSAARPASDNCSRLLHQPAAPPELPGTEYLRPPPAVRGILLSKYNVRLLWVSKDHAEAHWVIPCFSWQTGQCLKGYGFIAYRRVHHRDGIQPVAFCRNISCAEPNQLSSIFQGKSYRELSSEEHLVGIKPMCACGSALHATYGQDMMTQVNPVPISIYALAVTIVLCILHSLMPAMRLLSWWSSCAHATDLICMDLHACAYVKVCFAADLTLPPLHLLLSSCHTASYTLHRFCFCLLP